MFRVGILWRIQRFLSVVSGHEITSAEFLRNYRRFYYAESKEVLEVAQRYEWVAANGSGKLVLTDSGQQVLAKADSRLRLRKQLHDILLLSPPPWIGLLERGRSGVLHYGTINTIQCFRDAGLLDDADAEVASWWDSLAVPLRSSSDARRLEIGRKGEWLSIQYEQDRVGSRPQWTALDNASQGYDLLSRVSHTSDESLAIEVKASEEPWESANFHLTRKEWAVLSSERHAVVHLWSLAATPPALYILMIPSLRQHICSDNGRGEWESVRIPFQCCTEK